MPVIAAAAGIPGTQIGIGIRVARQTPREKEHDVAMGILEQDARQHIGAASVDPIRTDLDDLLSSPSLLDRLGVDFSRADGSRKNDDVA